MTDLDESVYKGPRLEPPPPAQLSWVRWLLLLMGANAFGMTWLAVQFSTPESGRSAMDGIMRILVGAATAYAGYRILTRFAFRTLELVAMVFVLGLGVQATLYFLENFSRVSFLWEGSVQDREKLPTVLQLCLFTSSLLLAGAAWGLRYCEKLRIEGSLGRVWAMVSGMLLLPAAALFVTLPTSALFGLMAGADDLDTLVYLLLWMGSFVVCAWNLKLFVASLALHAGIKDGE
ncbi:MAG: hypothetical protein M5U26_26555 [Planctomycetota bacterium]|nr:hypothetical protein [Planctomycetota bacterium]